MTDMIRFISRLSGLDEVDGPLSDPELPDAPAFDIDDFDDDDSWGDDWSSDWAQGH